jgi:ATP-binding cassette ChvD family protein
LEYEIFQLYLQKISTEKSMADDKKVIFSMVGVSKIYPPQKQVLKNIYLSFFYGAKIGIIGLNGSGKSTLLKIIAGLERDYQGETVFSPGYSVGYLEQDPQLTAGKTVKEIVREGVQETVDLLKAFEEVNEKFGDPETLEDPDKMEALMNRQAEIQDKIDALDAWNLDSRLERAMDALRCPPEDRMVDTLSGGERRRVALCRLLLKQPDILLLDEPTNHLDAESIDWLEQHLQQYAGTVICITHDRYFLDHVAGWILELDRGEGIPWKGNYSSWLEQKTNRMAKEEKQAGKRRKTLERELEWIRMAPKARHAKGKARLNSYESLLNEDQKEREAKLEIFIPNGPRLGNKVIEARDVAKAFGEKLLFDSLNFMLPPNGIVGVIGPNGAGKTTLFRMIMGMESVDKGVFEVGETVKIGYADQTHRDIDLEKTIFQVVTGGTEFIRVGGKEINSRAYLSRFNFTGADQEKLCKTLSGGERNRLHLAITLKSEANVLLLDEPTNDIDVNTLRALEEGLEGFAGCAVVISHDRWFLDRICTHILSFEGNSRVVFYEGSYSEYEAYKRKQPDYTGPERIRYRKLV